ncbi:MAG: hypothetical protein K2O37_01800, partial [Bacteroidales bacterium]|nr:hypothetical protein [Bacteroidales bacterium]
NNAAVLLPDMRVVADLCKVVIDVFSNTRRRELLAQNISRLGTTSAARNIVDQVLKLAQKGRGNKQDKKEQK